MIQGEYTIREIAHLWRARRDDGLSAAERREFDSWIAADPRHGEFFAEAEILWQAFEQDPLAERLRDLAPPGISRLPTFSERNPSKSSWFGMAVKRPAAVSAAVAFSMAVVLFLAIGLPRIQSPEPMEIQHFASPTSATKAIRLTDGSQVILGPRSRFAVTFSKRRRDARLLSGTAFFDVAHDRRRPFTIATAFGDVRVTGTRFDMQLRETGLSVAVAEGTVRVSPPRAAKKVARRGFVDLSAGQEIRSTSDALGPVAVVRPSEVAAWRTGRLTYVRATLSDVVGDLNRYADRTIIVDPAAGELRLSGTFDIRAPDGVLTTIDEALPVHMVERGNELVIEHD